jgi:hypothetical protein
MVGSGADPGFVEPEADTIFLPSLRQRILNYEFKIR